MFDFVIIAHGDNNMLMMSKLHKVMAVISLALE